MQEFFDNLLGGFDLGDIDFNDLLEQFKAFLRALVGAIKAISML